MKQNIVVEIKHNCNLCMKIIVVYAFLLLLMSCNNSRNNLLKEIEDKDFTFYYIRMKHIIFLINHKL